MSTLADRNAEAMKNLAELESKLARQEHARQPSSDCVAEATRGIQITKAYGGKPHAQTHPVVLWIGVLMIRMVCLIQDLTTHLKQQVQFAINWWIIRCPSFYGRRLPLLAHFDVSPSLSDDILYIDPNELVHTYYATERVLTVFTLSRWIEKYAHQTISQIDMIYYIGDRARRSIIDLQNGKELITKTDVIGMELNELPGIDIEF